MKLHHNYFVYIVECKDNFYYTGVTNDLERRLWEHNTGFNKKCYTYKRRPVELKYYQRFSDINDAIEWEKQLKGWGRKKKQDFVYRKLGIDSAVSEILSCKDFTWQPFDRLRVTATFSNYFYIILNKKAVEHHSTAF